MRPSLHFLLMVAFLIWGVSACSEKAAMHIGPTSEAPKTDIAIQTGGVTKPTDAPTTNVANAEAGKLKPAAALKVILLQLLVAR